MPTTDRLADRVVVVTGAGSGLGREYALFAAANGAKVVVNDLGTSLGGDGTSTSAAAGVVAEIEALGGTAVANTDDISEAEGGRGLLATALEAFGDVHVLINNAGILRDKMLVTMDENQWDAVIKVHLRGHWSTTHAVAGFWREQAKQGIVRDRVLVSTTSMSGLLGIPGQANYGAAKGGLATFALVAHREMNERLGVRSYAVAPSARTRLTLSTPDAAENVGRAVAEGEFDYWDAGNVAPFVLWLGAEGCPAPSGSVYGVEGDRIQFFEVWPQVAELRAGHRWTWQELDDSADRIVKLTPELRAFLPSEQA
ncbi:SDR family NAD(P)-dependent oxidoreductase [Rhodococcus sp. 2H158]